MHASFFEVARIGAAFLPPASLQPSTPRRRPLSASHAAMERFDADRKEAAKTTIWNSGCKSWYLDTSGIPPAWPWTFDRFREEMSKPRLRDFEMR